MTISEPSGVIALRVVELEVVYGEIRALQGVSLDLEQGSITAIVGANGAGKSSLLKAIAGLVSIQRGRVEIPAGVDVTDLPTHQRVRDLGVVMVPEGRGVFGGMTVDENLVMGLRIGRPRSSSEENGWEQRMDEIFELFPPLKERRELQARYLSGGEQQMLALSRSLLMEPSVLLVDEPSIGLAPLAIQTIFEKLRQVMATESISILLVEQDAKLALDLADWAYVIENGEIQVVGSAREVAENPRLQEAYLGG